MMRSNDQRVECCYKKSLYSLPKKSKIFLINNRLIFEVNQRRTRNIAQYKSMRKVLTCRYRDKIELPITSTGSQIAQEYQEIRNFYEHSLSFNLLKFEGDLNHELRLCTFFKPFQFVNIGSLLQEIQRVTPFLINIFCRPFIHLNENEVIQPVDAVQRINNKTIMHLSKHSENWKNYDTKKNTVVPDKLLTRTYVDDYSIYENRVFYQLMSDIFIFLRKTMSKLTDILEAFNDTLQLDPLNRYNHPMYYLAVGKLYVGFYNMENTTEITTLLEDCKKVYEQLMIYRTRPVFSRNKNIKPVQGDIKKTNIFAMHKDYKHVYNLYQAFHKKSDEKSIHFNDSLQIQGQINYEYFCQSILLFSISNFNYTCVTENNIYENKALLADFAFLDWRVKITNHFIEILGINTFVIEINHQKKTLKYLIIPNAAYLGKDRASQYEFILERLHHTDIHYDKYLFFEPFEDAVDFGGYHLIYHYKKENIEYALLPISLSDISSFRRIQKVLLEGMMSCNESFDSCAFCGEQLTQVSKDHYQCKKCKTVVKNVVCKACLKPFISSYFELKVPKKARDKKPPLRFQSELIYQEKKYAFRNIADMGSNGAYCPHCLCENEIKE